MHWRAHPNTRSSIRTCGAHGVSNCWSKSRCDLDSIALLGRGAIRRYALQRALMGRFWVGPDAQAMSSDRRPAHSAVDRAIRLTYSKMVPFRFHIRIHAHIDPQEHSCATAREAQGKRGEESPKPQQRD